MLPKSDEQNRADALHDLKAAGHKISEIGLLGAMTMLFGQYAGVTFKFITENDLGYLIYLLESDENQRDTDREIYKWKADMKLSLLKYITLLPEYPEMVQLIKHRKHQQSLPFLEREVSFGKYKRKKIQELLLDKSY